MRALFRAVPPAARRAIPAAAAATVLALSAGAAEPAAVPGGDDALRQLREARHELAHRPRGIIFNNDGCDCLYFPTNLPVTVSNFLARRTTPLAGTQVGAISYCTISSGFGFFTHRTRAGTVLTRQPGDYGLRSDMRNIAQDLIDQGTDCLQAVLGFAHSNRMECFWSMRMNDTHDAAHRPDKPYMLFPPLKEEHPRWLVGRYFDRARQGRWSSVDYARPEIRDLAFRYIEEVCRNYDVDGVELDFLRHSCFFKSTAGGGAASGAERDLMTGLMRRVRAMTEEVGLRRGRPVLVIVRANDSAGFNRDLGLDVEGWMREGLLDLLVTTCYFRLNPWETSVATGRAHGIPVYPCLSDSRVEGEGRFRRGSIECYRGRAMNAWAAGADGIHLFNLFDVAGPRSPVFSEIGDPRTLQTMSKLYFATVRDGSPERWLAGGSKYRTIPILVPSAPQPVTAARPLRIALVVGETVADAAGARATLHAQLPGLTDPAGARVTLNGRELGGGKRVRDWLDLPVEPSWIRKGSNEVRIARVAAPVSADAPWTVEFKGDRLPGRPWTTDKGSAATGMQTTNGALLVADRGAATGDYRYVRHAWSAEPGGGSAIEARVKVISGLSRVIFSDGASQERLELRPDGIGLWSRRGFAFAMDTTDAFHVYRIETRGRHVRVFVDGEPRIDASDACAKPADGRNEVCFGASDSFGVGEALWEYVRVRADGFACKDLVLEIARGPQAPPAAGGYRAPTQ